MFFHSTFIHINSSHHLGRSRMLGEIQGLPSPVRAVPVQALPADLLQWQHLRITEQLPRRVQHPPPSLPSCHAMLPFKLSAPGAANLLPAPRSINPAFLGSITCPPPPCAVDWIKLRRQARLEAAADGGMAWPGLFHPLGGGRRRPNSDRTAPRLQHVATTPAFLPRPDQVTMPRRSLPIASCCFCTPTLHAPVQPCTHHARIFAGRDAMMRNNSFSFV